MGKKKQCIELVASREQQKVVRDHNNRVGGVVADLRVHVTGSFSRSNFSQELVTELRL